ncbi:DAPIT protein [Trinorchestia longiramus]|nr:DAPIT protein [Trinorchestia longiramus]
MNSLVYYDWKRSRERQKEPKMAGDEASQFKGLAKYFNSTTNAGRKNTALATYAVLGVVIFYNLVKPKKKQQ